VKQDVTYKVSGPLILSGGLQTTSQAKCYHALLVLAQMKGWKADARGMMRVTMGELHRLTGGTCKDWQAYRDTLDEIRRTVELDWGHLSVISRGKFNRSGKCPILSECYVDLDLAGEPVEVAFRVSQDLIEDVIRPSWYGQVRPDVLFRQKSNYAFNAYLYASLYVVEKDSAKTEFYGPAVSSFEWRSILGVPDGTYPRPAHFRAFVFRRTEEQIAKTTKDTDTPLSVEWRECSGGTYQMVVKRVQRPVKARLSPRAAVAKAEEAEDARRRAEQRALDMLAQDWVRGHPRRAEITTRCQKAFGRVNHFALMMVCPELGLELPESLR
jgi:hypothetical protein